MTKDEIRNTENPDNQCEVIEKAVLLANDYTSNSELTKALKFFT